MSTLNSLLNILELEKTDERTFVGKSFKSLFPRVFGGQVIAQALTAATQTIDADKTAHSLHAYFLLGGDPQKPIRYVVKPVRDGKSFSMRMVEAMQDNEIIFSTMISFQKPETGLEHQFEMPKVPSPEEAKINLQAKQDDFSNMQRMLNNPWPVEVVPCEPMFISSRENKGERVKLPPYQHTWIRVQETLPTEEALHKAALAFISDLSLMMIATKPHGASPLHGDIVGASLDHAIWFQRPFNANEWLLYAMESPSAFHATGLNRGHFFNQKGELVAATFQESLIRPTPKFMAQRVSP